MHVVVFKIVNSWFAGFTNWLHNLKLLGERELHETATALQLFYNGAL